MSFNTKDKTERVTVRLNTYQLSFIEKLADDYNCSVSDVIRMFVNSMMWGGEADEHK